MDYQEVYTWYAGAPAPSDEDAKAYVAALVAALHPSGEDGLRPLGERSGNQKYTLGKSQVYFLFPHLVPTLQASPEAL